MQKDGACEVCNTHKCCKEKDIFAKRQRNKFYNDFFFGCVRINAFLVYIGWLVKLIQFI